MAWIDAHRDQYSAGRLCRVLNVSCSGSCQWRRSQANTALDADDGAVHRTNRGSYGSPHIVALLRARGQRVGAERVRRSLQRQGLRPVYKRSYRV